MDLQEKISVTATSSLAVELTERDVQHLAGIIEVRSLQDGDVLMREGELDNALYAVISGRLAVEKEDAQGGETVTLHILGKGDLAGELGFVDGNEHTATLRAVGNTEVMALGRDALEGFLDEHPQIVYYVMRAIVRSGHAIVRRMNLQYVELSNYMGK